MTRTLARRKRRATVLVALVALLAFAAGVAYACPPPVITSRPAELTRSTVARFTFSDTESGLTFWCSLDGSAYRGCSSPKTYFGLAARRHTFSVKVENSVGGSSRSTSYSWTIHTAPPAIKIRSPRPGRVYSRRRWSAGCSRHGGVCGSARDPFGVAAVRVSIRQNATRRYWNGRAFRARKQLYLRARLRHASGGRRAWSYALPLPAPDGAYTLHVRATDRLGDTTPRRSPARVAFRTDTVTPTVQITSYPHDPSTSRSARFTFVASETHVRYVCSLDGRPGHPCSGTVHYQNLALGLHTWRVRVIDAAGNSSSARYSWRIVSPEPLTIGGDLVTSGGVLSPGLQPKDIPVTLGNPNDVTIHVTAVSVVLQSTGASGCSAAWFEITPASIPQSGVAVAPHSSITLPAQGATAPAIQLIESGTNQDACQGARLTLAYSGSAHS